MLLRPQPLLLAARAPPPPAGQRRGGGQLLVESAEDIEQWGGQVSKVIWGGTHVVGGMHILLAL